MSTYLLTSSSTRGNNSIHIHLSRPINKGCKSEKKRRKKIMNELGCKVRNEMGKLRKGRNNNDI
jgi:hypothetical protein